MSARRAYGTGSLYTRTSSAGIETYYGRWRSGDQQHGSRIGPVRVKGTRNGLTKTQAEKALGKLMSNTPEQKAAPGERLSIEELGERYVRAKKSQWKFSTFTAVESILDKRIVPYFGDKALDAYKENDVQTWVAVLEADGLTNKTIQNYVGLVSSLFRYAVRKKLARENPCDGVELPVRVSNGKIRFLDPVEVEALVRCAVPGSYEAIDRALYMTAAMTGLRQGELLALRWRDVDWTAGRVRVEQSYVLGKFDTPKSGKVRSVPLADTLGGELDRLHKASSFDGDEDLVFADPDTGLPMMRGCLMRRYRRALNAAHVDPTHRFHDLRHTFGTRMAKARVPIRTLQEWMGHADMKTTLIYVGYAPSEHEVAQVNAAFAVEALQPTPTQEIVNNGSHKGDSSGGSFPPRGS